MLRGRGELKAPPQGMLLPPTELIKQPHVWEKGVGWVEHLLCVHPSLILFRPEVGRVLGPQEALEEHLRNSEWVDRHFADRETEARGGYLACPGSQSQKMVREGLESQVCLTLPGQLV